MNLSIIIPTLNEEKYLPLLLEEIKKQNFEDYEIIIADGGSKDKTVEIAKNYGCKITSDGSPTKARNKGAKIAQGDLFLFFDADIISLSSQFFKNFLEEFKNRNLDVASFPVYPQGNKLDKLAYGIYNFLAKLTQGFLAHATQALLVKREIHQKIGGFDEEIKIGEDHAYVREASKFAKFGFINTEPIFTSARRFEREGRLKTYLKYFLAGVYMFFLGPVKSDIFKYRFNHSLKKPKNHLK